MVIEVARKQWGEIAVLHHSNVCFQMPEKGFSERSLSQIQNYNLSDTLPRSKNYVTSEGVVPHNVLYCQHSILLVTKKVFMLIMYF